MFKNYFKVALRQLRKQKMYSVIKVGGFALSIAACVLIGLYIKNELSYDQNYPDKDRIYRLVGEYRVNGEIEHGLDFEAPLAPTMQGLFPQIESVGRIMPNSLFYRAGSNEVRRSDLMENAHEDNFVYADQQILDILQLPMAYGTRTKALSQPNTIVISKRKAEKYFPGQNPVGKLLVLNNETTKPLLVTAVMENIPETSHLKPIDFMITLKGVEFYKGEQTNWDASNYTTFIKLKPGTDVHAFEKHMADVLFRNYMFRGVLKSNPQFGENLLKNSKLVLQPVADIHLKSYDMPGFYAYGDIRFVWLFGAIAVFILVIACINFINLSTAKSANRAKEVGLRKVVGSTRSGLINQFLTESTIYSVLSFAIGVALAAIAMPYFNILAAKSLTIPLFSWWFVPVILLSAVLVGVAAGLYPAFYLSGFKPVKVLKGSISSGSKGSILRNGLVVFQFTTSIILIISTIVIYNQTEYVLHKKVGFDKDQVVMIQGTNTLGDSTVKVFKSELTRIAAIKSASISDYLPVDGTKRNGNTFYNEVHSNGDNGIDTQYWQIDDTYLQTLGIKLLAGHNFSYDRKSDEQGIIINQNMVKQLGLKDPIDKMITNGYGHYRIVGVVEDFNFQSMRQGVGAVALHFGLSPSIVSVKIKGADVQNTIQNITRLWKSFSPNQPIRYTFLDQEFANMYADVQRTGSIFTIFAVLAIAIACLGLFALAAFMAEQRSKEIGIRKVLGASIRSVTTLLSADFIKLVVLAIVIASPIAWWAMTKWLQEFNIMYRITISWWIFVLTGITAIAIAVATVSYQSIKAAVANPIKSLRSE